ncbi:ArnT family glycosyltransferase [candidate division CSSED10-310 bacterium]|uniref:ArnT family glycosyltransferase n=1 Tax=candidate division CSSED10-310 bacterium TaxID=2855610 RepID=A0ABV6YZR9_UNCC1
MPDDTLYTSEETTGMTSTMTGKCAILVCLVSTITYSLFLYFNWRTFHLIGNYGSETDFFWAYAPTGQQFADGDLSLSDLFNRRGSVYIFVLTLINRFWDDWFLSGCFLSNLSAGFVLLLTYLLVSRIFNPATGWFCFFSLCANLIYQRHTYEAGYDMFNLLLVMISLTLLFKEGSLKINFLGGIFGGLAFLTRSNMVIFLPFILILGIEGLSWRNYHYKRVGSALSGFSIIFVAKIVNNIFLTGSFLDSSSSGTLIKFYYLDSPRIAARYPTADQFMKAGGSFIDLILFDPVFFIKRYFSVLGKYLYHDFAGILGLPIIILIGVGMILAFFTKWTIPQKKLLFFIIPALLILALTYHRQRYSLPHLFIYFIIAFYPLTIVSDRLSRLKRRGIYVCLIALLISLFITNYRKSVTEMKDGPYDMLSIAEYMKKNVGDKDVIITSRKPHIGYYANLKWQPLIYDFKTPAELSRWAIRENVSYLYWSSIEDLLLVNLRFLNTLKKHGAWEPEIYTQYSILYKLKRPSEKMFFK